ncbi:MAG: efflux RND transporter permease subunit, partial [Spirochaetales bacterium]|nr:efflux RND transporter permease subunit [Spirochaetales bacterium]
NMSLLEVYAALDRGSVSFPGGDVQMRSYRLNLRTEGKFDSLDKVAGLTLGYREGVAVRLGDVADIAFLPEDPENYALSRGEETLSVGLVRRSGADTSRVIAEARQALDSLEREFPGLIFRTVGDDGVNITLSMSSVRNAALTGALLAVLVLLFFLHNIRMTLIIGLSIPLSILFAFIGMKTRNMSLNLMTLGGLTVAIGMMVDSSIVVLENIHAHYSRGKSAVQAALDGTGEVGGAVLASTSTSLAVFIPLLFLQDYTGIMLKEVALTIVFSLFGAMVVSLVIVPWLSSLILKPVRVSRESPAGRAMKRIERAVDGLQDRYRRALESVLAHPRFTLFSASFFLLISLLIFNLLGFTFLGPTDMGEINIYLEMPDSYTLEETRDKTAEVLELINARVPELESELAYPGQQGLVSLTSSPVNAFAVLRLVPRSKRSRSAFDIMDDLRTALASEIPDLDFSVRNGGLNAMVDVSFGGGGYGIELSGSDLDEVIRSARRIEFWMSQDPDCEDTELNISVDTREGIIKVDTEQAARLGINPTEAAYLMRFYLKGESVGSYSRDGTDLDIYLTTTATGAGVRQDLLNTILVPSASGKQISMAGIADLELRETYAEVKHSDRLPSVIVTAFLKGSDIRGINSRITKRIEEEGLPSGINWKLSGSASETFSAFSSLARVILIALFLVYTVMVIQFERFRQPLIVMASVPFVLAGMALALLMMGSAMTIVGFLGGITLAGIVVNNAIVMIDYINLLRSRDTVPLREAVLTGASTRLKPILMSTLTTVLGIVPMAMGVGEGSEVYAPLGQTIAGGLLTSTLVTLFLVPLIYHKVEESHARRKTAAGAGLQAAAASAAGGTGSVDAAFKADQKQTDTHTSQDHSGQKEQQKESEPGSGEEGQLGPEPRKREAGKLPEPRSEPADKGRQKEEARHLSYGHGLNLVARKGGDYKGLHGSSQGQYQNNRNQP